MPAKTIRFYESIGLIRPAQRRENGYRAYSEDDVAVLRFIHRARGLGFTVKEVADLLTLWHDESLTSSDLHALSSRHLSRIDAKARELESLRDVVRGLTDRDSVARPSVDPLRTRPPTHQASPAP